MVVEIFGFPVIGNWVDTESANVTVQEAAGTVVHICLTELNVKVTLISDRDTI